MPSFAAKAAVWRAWFDWVAPCVMTMSAPSSSASAMRNSSFRVLLPPRRKTGAVVPLDPDLRSAKLGAQTVEALQRRGQMREEVARKAGEVHRVSSLF